MLFYGFRNYEIQIFEDGLRKISCKLYVFSKYHYYLYFSLILTSYCHVYFMSFVSFIKIFIYNIFQIEDDLATYVGAGSKVKDMTAVNTVSIVITL